jgi:outer membrane protein assembly factor BamB
MKLFCILIILLFISHCSFDNKTGIWKTENNISKKNKTFEEFKSIDSSSEQFDKIVQIDPKFRFNINNKINNFAWKDIYYNKSNNYDNFNYNNLNKLISKSKKISRNKVNNYLLFENKDLLINDQKGNLIIYSIEENKIIRKYNFYKKKFKKVNKNLNLVIEKNIIYVSDNLGYLYAYNYLDNKILWAKYYKVPFRSNLKIANGKLIAANQNNILFFFNKNTGEILKTIPTEEIILNNQFVNNLSLNEKSAFFLNTYGSLYSIDIETMRLNWFLNLNKSFDLNSNQLFMSKQVINNNDKIVISSRFFTYIINSNNGSIVYKFNYNSTVKPLMVNNFLFSLTKDGLLVSMNLDNGKIIYSYDINQKIAEFLNIKKKQVTAKGIYIADDKLLIFLNNSYLLKLDIYGNLEKVNQLPGKLNTNPIFIDKFLLYLDNKNKILTVN